MKIKLFRILNKLSTTTFNRFSDYCRSPYFSTPKHTSDLLTIYKKHNPQNIGDLQNHLRKIDTKFDSQLSVRQLLSKTTNSFTNFMAIENLRDEDMVIKTHALSYILDNGLEELYATVKSQIEKLRDRNQPVEHQSFYNYKYLQLKYKIEGTELQRITRKKDEREPLLDFISELDQFYFAEKVRNMITLKTWARFIGASDKTILEDEILALISGGEVEQNLSIQIYSLIHRTLVDPTNEEHFHNLAKLVREHILEFPKIQQKEILDSTINYALKKVNQGEEGYLEHLFDLYDFGIRTFALLPNDSITPWAFKNIVSVGLRTKKYKWVQAFIDDYHSYLPQEYDHSSTALARAQLSFYQKDFEQVLFHLQDVEYKEFSYATTSRSLQIAAFYELDEYNLLTDSALSFKKFLNRFRKISLERKELFKNMIDMIMKLIKIDPKDYKKLRLLRATIEQTKGLASKTWLLEKVDELLGEPIGK